MQKVLLHQQKAHNLKFLLKPQHSLLGLLRLHLFHKLEILHMMQYLVLEMLQMRMQYIVLLQKLPILHCLALALWRWWMH
jgi:hypothetical protein